MSRSSRALTNRATWLLGLAACGQVSRTTPADAPSADAAADLPCEQRAVPCGGIWAGTGAEGDLDVPAPLDLVAAAFTRPLTVTTIAGSAIGVSARAGHLARNDEVVLLYLHGTAGEIDRLGDYETAFVDSVSDTQVVLRAPVQRSYPATSDAASGSAIVLMRIPQFQTIEIEPQGSLFATGFDGMVGGVVFLRAQHLEVRQGGLISMTAAGYRGSAPASNGVSGDSGETYVAGTVHGGPPLRGAGGGGTSDCDAYSCSSQSVGAGGGGAGYGAPGAPGAPNGSLQTGGLPGGAYGDGSLSQLFLGSGGGGGAGGVSGPGSSTAGGNGGGIIVIRADTIHIAGGIESNGQPGSTNDNCSAGNGSGGGGGGAGGTVWLSARTLQIEGTIQAIGGGASCHGGGAGGDGRIRLDFEDINGAAVGSAAAMAAVSATTMPLPGLVGAPQ